MGGRPARARRINPNVIILLSLNLFSIPIAHAIIIIIIIITAVPDTRKRCGERISVCVCVRHRGGIIVSMCVRAPTRGRTLVDRVGIPTLESRCVVLTPS